ncbi:MAG: efflux RND transporter permease subunit [Microvirgula sp.]
MFSAFFIRRPIFASVISIIIMLAGIAAIKALPIAQYPNIVPPQVSVTTSYPGASAETIAKSVAAPLETQINGVDNMLYLQSASASNGSLTITVTFAIGTDPDQNTINVNNRVQAAMAQLPQEVTRQGVTVQKKSSTILMVPAIYSPDDRFNQTYISNYTLVNIIDDIKRIPGVGDASIFGASDYSMRVWIRPDRLAQLKLTPADISNAINEQNAQFAAGKVGAEPTSGKPVDFTYTVTAKGRLETPEEFGQIIVRSNPDGSKIRLKDIARIELGAKDYYSQTFLNGKPATLFGVYLAPGANQIAVSDAVQAKLKELSGRFPEGITYKVPYDTTKFIKVSIEEVVHTLFEAMVLVFLVVYLFLQNWRATLIPCLAVPVSIVGTFAGMYLLGFSINTLTMFGMVLAIGIVVDDAIVVLENVERLMRTEHLSPTDAAIKAMQEVTGPVVAIVLVLCSVFIPVSFLGGLAGQMYKQFAVTIAVSVVISGIVALTLTPALCALLLKDHDHSKKPNRFFCWFNDFFEKATGRYTGGVSFLLKRSAVGLLLFAGIIAVTLGLFRHVPGGLVPDEDQGYVLTQTFLPDGASLTRTQKAVLNLQKVASENPATADVVTINGLDLLSGGTYKTYNGVTFLPLKDWKEREKHKGQDSFSYAKEIMQGTYGDPTSLTMAFNPPPISGMSNTGGFEAYVQDRTGGTSQDLEAALKKFIDAARKRPELTGINTLFSANVPQIYLDLDREKAKALSVPINDVFAAMQSTFGAYYVNDFNKYGRPFRVQIQSESDFRSRPEDIRNVYVRSTKGDMIPLSALVNVKQVKGTEVAERFNVFAAAKVMGGPAQGYSSGQAIQIMEQVAAESLPDGYTLAWTGTAYQEKATSGSSAIVFIAGLIMVFLILAAQYEKWSLPLAVLMAVPFALFGAITANFLRGLANDVYFQIALVTLIGLAAKNAILIIEFAVMRMHEEGESLAQAAVNAARLRFRPIIMTSLAFVLGCVPLAIASGAGAASRHSIGTGIIGGMLAATFVATFFIPMFFVLIMKLFKGDKPVTPPATPPTGTDGSQGGHA